MGLFSKEKISKGGDKQGKSEEKKDKWGSIRYKQANNIYNAEIKNRINGALRPRARTGHQSAVLSSCRQGTMLRLLLLLIQYSRDMRQVCIYLSPESFPPLADGQVKQLRYGGTGVHLPVSGVVPTTRRRAGETAEIRGDRCAFTCLQSRSHHSPAGR